MSTSIVDPLEPGHPFHDKQPSRNGLPIRRRTPAFQTRRTVASDVQHMDDGFLLEWAQASIPNGRLILFAIATNNN